MLDVWLFLLVQHYEGDVADLCLDFTVVESEFGSQVACRLDRE